MPEIQARMRQVGARRDADRPGHRRRHLPGPAPRARWWPPFRASGWWTTARSTIPRRREGEDAQARRRRRSPSAPSVDLQGALELLLDSPNIASKRWVYEQYDSTVQASTVLGPGGDAGVLRVPGTAFGLAVTVDCNNRLVALDPYEGGKATVAEAARNIACTGALPLGITDCLNFGNPEKPEVFFQFRRGLPGHRRRLPRVRHAGHRRQRELLQRESHAAPSIRPPPSAWSACSTAWRSGCRAILRAGRRDPHPRRDQRRARGLRLLGRGVRLHRRPARGVDLDAERPAAAAAGRGGRAAAAPLGARLFARAAWPWRWRKRPSAAPTPRGPRRHGGPDRLRPGCAAGRVLYGEDGARAVVSVRPADLRGRSWRSPGSTGCRCSGPGRSDERGGALELRVGPQVFSWAPSICGRPISWRSPAGCSIRTWTARRESKACAASSASPGSLTRPGSPTSASTPCSTEGRRARASSRSTARATPARTAAWDW